MDAAEFRRRGREMVDFVADYLETINQRRVLPEVKPGYLTTMLPDKAPVKPEKWTDIMADVNNAILPGITHWQHPRFHAYFPAGNSYPSILADMLSDAIGCVGFSWAASPACTELETLVLDWVAKMIDLPRIFWHEQGIGGGVIQGSASECVLVSMLAARHEALQELKRQHPGTDDGVILSRMVAYCSKLAHSCVEKAGMLCLVKMRQLNIDENYSLRGSTLQKAIDEDRRNGLFPFFVCATIGTTAVCSFDNLDELGPICDKESLWLHVDAAYAGSALICPEFRHLIKGVEHVKSFNMNPNKWMLVNFDCSTMWVSNRAVLMNALTVDPLYLQHSHSDKAVDFRHWGIPLSRRFRALKLWFVIRTYGVEGLQAYIREHCRLAKLFETLVKTDIRFEVKGPVSLGLVCFRLKSGNQDSQLLLRAINMSGKLHMVPAVINDDYVIRFAVCSPKATESDIKLAWKVIADTATQLSLFAAARPSLSFIIDEAAELVARQYSSKRAASNHELCPLKGLWAKQSKDCNAAIPERVETEDEDTGELDDQVSELSRTPKTPPMRLPSSISALSPPKSAAEINGVSAEDEDDVVFLFDNNIPSIASRMPPAEVQAPESTQEYRRRNKLLRMISDPRACGHQILRRSYSHDSGRHQSDGSSRTGLAASSVPTKDRLGTSWSNGYLKKALRSVMGESCDQNDDDVDNDDTDQMSNRRSDKSDEYDYDAAISGEFSPPPEAVGIPIANGGMFPNRRCPTAPDNRKENGKASNLGTEAVLALNGENELDEKHDDHDDFVPSIKKSPVKSLSIDSWRKRAA